MDNNSLSHTTWNCKYHIVFAPKYRRKIIYGELKQDIANILSALYTRMAKSGMNPKILQTLMGRSDIGTTLNIYTHVNLEDIQKEVRKIGNS